MATNLFLGGWHGPFLPPDAGRGALPPPELPSGICGCGAAGDLVAGPFFAAALAVFMRRRGGRRA